MEKMILKWCKDQRNKNKVVTRGIIFHKALCIYSKHSGGNSNNKIFTDLKSWFYGGFKKRAKLSKCRISSTGQKLPEKLEVMVERIIDRVAQKQMPQQRPGGSFHLGVTDANMGNTHQVLVYIEDHSKDTWGMREDHTRRTVVTAGKENDRFTSQLTAFKYGTKIRGLLIHS